MFKNISLDDTLNPKSFTADLEKLPKLASYLTHCWKKEELLFFCQEAWEFELPDISAT